MDQLKDFADDRLISGCIYCGGPAETRDHVPSRILLEPPYPENLPVVGACQSCNQGFSTDEQYLVCLIESALAGSTDPDKIMRPSVARTMRRSPALKARIEAAKREREGRTEFAVEEHRILNVMLKLARGHAAFELSQSCPAQPDHFWCGPLEVMSQDEREAFNSVHMQQMFGEIGSRGLQRMLVIEAGLRSGDKWQPTTQMLVTDWIDVQVDRYRYLSIDDLGEIVVRIVISEYLACEVGWRRES